METGDLYLTVLFLVIVVGITIATLRLYLKISSLQKQGNSVPLDKGTIMFVMWCYNGASVLSAILNATVLPKAYSDSVTISVWYILGWTIVPGILTDCLPIVAVMYLHLKNYSEKQIFQEPIDQYITNVTQDDDGNDTESSHSALILNGMSGSVLSAEF